MDILIIRNDDSVDNMVKLLENHGHRVIGRAVSISKALNLLDELKPNVVIISMDKTDEKSQANLGENIVAKGISVLYIIDNRSQEDILKKALQNPSVSYIVRPFSDDEFIRAIEMLNFNPLTKNKTEIKVEGMDKLLNELDFAVILTDQQGIITYNNRSAVELLDYDTENHTLIGISLQSAVNFFNETTDTPIRFIFSSQIPTSEKVFQEAILLTQSGQKMNVLYIFKPLSSSNDEIIGYLLTFQDITRLKEEFASLRQQNDLLEAKITERTNNLLRQNILLEREIHQRLRFEKELEQALAKAKESNFFRSNIVSTLSHEFRTPLTTIQSSVDIIERLIGSFSETDKIQKHFYQIKMSIKTLGEMLNDVLEIEKTDNQSELELSTIRPLEFFEELIDNFRLGIGSKHNIDFQHNAMPMEMQTNPKLLSQILNNLVSNACKYSDENTTVRIIILFNENRLHISVSDEGRGIPEDDLPHIFKTFYRSKTVENIPGSGLGLSILKKAVEALQGEISVKTMINSGSRFTIILPLH